MKVIIVQKNVGNLNYISFIEEAVDRGADLVCFNELATSGCLYRPCEVTAFDEVLASLQEFPIGVMLGVPRLTAEGMYNSCVYIHEGKVQIYDKIHLFEPMNEHGIYLPGTRPGLFDSRYGKLGVAVCYDIRFPELFDMLAEGGATRIFVPAAFPKERIDDWKKLLVERALKTGVPVVGINAVGDDAVNEFGGCSAVVDGQGRILAQAGATREELLEVDL